MSLVNILTVMHLSESSSHREEAGTAASGTAVPAPAPCSTCDGTREVPRGAHNGSTPCTSCCCAICGNVTDTPPECGVCFVREESDTRHKSESLRKVREDPLATDTATI